MGRYKRYASLLIILLIAAFFLTPIVWQQSKEWVQRYQTSGEKALSDSISNSLVYPIKPEKWITFNLLAGTKQLKIISNAHILKPDSVTVEDNWKYILRYQLLDSVGKIILDKHYHQRSHLTLYKGLQGESLFGNFYSGHGYTPLDGRLILLSMQEIQQATSIRISYIQTDQEVKEAAVRLYIPAKISEHKLSATWLRMSAQQQKKVAKSNIYSPILLTEIEINNLLKNQWQPVGPIGIEDQDYVSRTLYIYKEVELEKQGDFFQATGIQLDQDHPVMIRIPEQGGHLNIKLRNLAGGTLKQSHKIQLAWFGRGLDQRWQHNDQWFFDTEQLTYSVKGGVLQIQTNSAEPVIVDASLITKTAGALDITPKPPITNGYLAKQQVDYQVRHVNNQTTTIRVDIRQFFQLAMIDSGDKVTYQWFDEKNKLIHSGQLFVDNIPAIYDRLKGEFKDVKLTDSVTYYLNIPANISRLRLLSEHSNIIVNAYNQPYLYAKKQRVPEYAFVSLDKRYWSPSWFLINPINLVELTKSQSIMKIAIQNRPPEDDPYLLKNQYLWEDYKPQEQAEARYLLTAMSTLDYRTEALANVYCQIPINKVRRINFKSNGNTPLISSELLYIRPKSTIFNSSIYIDNKLVFSRPAMGRQGRFNLPYLSKGLHSIKVKTDGAGKWLMNKSQKCSTQAYLKRRVFKFKNRQLTFLYNNNAVQDRMFSGRLFTSVNNKQRSILDVSIEALSPQIKPSKQDEWTFARRLYDIRPTQGNASIMMYSQGRYLSRGESFFLPFKMDMPKGWYKIKIKLNQGAGYLSFSQLQPGYFEQRHFFKDRNNGRLP